MVYILWISSLFLLYGIMKWRQRKAIDEIMKLIKQLKRGDYSIPMKQDDFAILEDEIYKLFLVLVEEREEIKKLSDSQIKNLENISHQIKIPITTMLFDLQLLEDSRELIETKLNDWISYDERYEILTGDEIKTAHTADLKSISYVMGGLALVIFILNVTNGYSSINLALLNRKSEIATLYSCGMDKSELKKKLTCSFIMEQIKSLFMVILLSIILMFIIPVFSSTFTSKILFSYFNYLIFILFAGSIYGVNILIYRSVVNKILNRPVIEVIK